MDPPILKLSKIQIMKRTENDIDKVEVNQRELNHEYSHWSEDLIQDLKFEGKKEMKNISFRSSSSSDLFDMKKRIKKR